MTSGRSMRIHAAGGQSVSAKGSLRIRAGGSASAPRPTVPQATFGRSMVVRIPGGITDTFTRTVETGWGTTTGNTAQDWSHGVTPLSRFSVDATYGRVTVPATSQYIWYPDSYFILDFTPYQVPTKDLAVDFQVPAIGAYAGDGRTTLVFVYSYPDDPTLNASFWWTVSATDQTIWLDGATSDACSLVAGAWYHARLEFDADVETLQVTGDAGVVADLSLARDGRPLPSSGWQFIGRLENSAVWPTNTAPETTVYIDNLNIIGSGGWA